MTLQRTCCLVEVVRIQIDDELRARVELNSAVVNDYANLLEEGAIFPPILLVESRDGLWLVDGSHRLEAHRKAARSKVVAEIRAGNREDAIWLSCAANQSHGLRRSNADKRRSVMRALVNPKGARLSNRQIAHYCGVHHASVSRVRAELETSGAIHQMNRRLAQRNGNLYEHDVTRIADANAMRFRNLGQRPNGGEQARVQTIDALRTGELGAQVLAASVNDVVSEWPAMQSAMESPEPSVSDALVSPVQALPGQLAGAKHALDSVIEGLQRISSDLQTVPTEEDPAQRASLTELLREIASSADRIQTGARQLARKLLTDGATTHAHRGAEGVANN